MMISLLICYLFGILCLSSQGEGQQVTTTTTASELKLPVEANLLGSFVQDLNLPVHYEIVKPILELAVDEVNRRFFNRLRFKVKVRNDTDSCFMNVAGALVSETYFTGKVDAIFGPACDIALDQVARLAAFWKVPVFTAGGWSSQFGDKETYNTLTRLSYSLDRVAHFLLQILRENDWHHICMIVDETDPSMSIFKKAIEVNFHVAREREDYELYVDVQILKSKDREKVQNGTIDYTHILKEASKSCRVLMLMMSDGELIREFLLAGYDLGFGNGDYAFIGLELIKGAKQKSSGDIGWYKLGSRRNKDAKLMYEALMVIAARIPITQEFETFAHRVAKMATGSSATGRRYSAGDVNPILAAFYDAVLIYATAMNSTIASGKEATDGKAVLSHVWGKSYMDVGLSGDVIFNENGDREADYTLNDLDTESGLMVPIATYFGAKKVYKKLAGMEVKWPGNNGSPADMPRCGFRGEDARCQESSKLPLIISLLIAFLTIVILSTIATFFIHQKLKYESSLTDMWWKLDRKELVFHEKKGTSASTAGIKSSTSLLVSNASFGTRKSGVSGGSGSRTSGYSTSIINLEGIDIAEFRGQKVAVKEITLHTKFHANREILMAMKEMLNCQIHDNLVSFYGMLIDEPHAFVMELCPRGSLKDIIENDSIAIDWLFRYSILTDVVEGMYFLHSTPIQYHGHLKSSNLLVDGRFSVKIGDYGLKMIYDNMKKEDQTNPRTLFWTAPEHLRSKDPLRSGSQKGDVYSFAIIVQEVITRNGPFEPSIERKPAASEFGVKHLDPDEILDKVRMSAIPPFRPEVTAEDCIECPDMITLLRSCWDENPSARPDFGRIKISLRKITKGVSSKNFLDNLLKRMEQYSNSLEAMVNEKTSTIVEEKVKAEELIHNLLPKFIAEELKLGKHVDPQTYDSVTIFFSDVMGFREYSDRCSPHETVEVLNDLYSLLDTIIAKYVVYKVETIADSYLVASGLPVRNGNEHAREIARMALDMRIGMRTFKPRREVAGLDKMQIRIGIHSGSCVAGVVGLKMPKYCLFGDAINTASRMETNGEAGRVHVSAVTKSILDLFGNFILLPRGEVEMKGKGKLKTFWLEGEDRTFH